MLLFKATFIVKKKIVTIFALHHHQCNKVGKSPKKEHNDFHY